MRVRRSFEWEGRADHDAQIGSLEEWCRLFEDCVWRSRCSRHPKTDGAGIQVNETRRFLSCIALIAFVFPGALDIRDKVTVGPYQGEAGSERLATDRVMDDVGPVHSRPRTQALADVLVSVVDAELGTERRRQLGLLARR